MFISGRSYGNSLKYKAFYACMSFMLMALFSTILTAKPAFADDGITGNITNGTMTCPKHGVFSYKPVDQGDGYWRCADEKQGASSNYTSFTCNTGYTKDEFSEERKISTIDNRTSTYKKGRCVKGSGSSSTSTVEKNAEALANKAGRDSLVTLISPKIETSPWYLGLSDADKVAAGCKYQSLPGAPSQASEKGWVCDDAAKQKLAKMLIGTCIASAVKTVAKRTNGDTGSGAMDAVFTSCLAGNSGIDEKTIKSQKSEIAWDDIKKDVNTSGSAATEESKADEAKNSCGIGGMGWLICPLMTFMGEIADASYSVISQFLNINPAIFGEGSDAVGAKQAWNFFRDIANVIFVLLFLWVIFSQVSSIGISNYGIKKILPKLIVGAILVNLSFYICQLAVDLSNILGFTLKEALEGSVSGVGGSSSNSEILSGFGAAVAGILVLTGTVLFAALAVSIPTLLSLMLVLLVVLVILIVRQAAIVLLISIAPLAFAAWLLPNTESLFKKWVSMFRGLLMVFPIISLLYGAGKLAGAILATTATSDSNDTVITMQFAALAASILPLGATPFVLKSSLNSLGSFAGKLGGLSGLANKKLGSAIANKSRISDARNAWKSRSARKLAERRSGNTRYGRAASNLRGSSSWFKKGVGIAMNPAAALDNNRFGRKLGLGDGVSAAQEAYDKAAMEKAERALTYKYGGDAAKALNDKDADKYIRIAATKQLRDQGTYGADRIAEYLSAGGKVDSVSMAKSLTDMKGSHAGVAKAGSEALKALQKEDGPSEINFSSDQFNNLTALGVDELSNKDIAGQSANAIKNSNITADQATEILSDDILYSSANNAVKSALREKGGERIIPQTPQDNQNDQQDDNSQQDNQNDQQGNSSSQQSSQNNQQSNSSSGGE